MEVPLRCDESGSMVGQHGWKSVAPAPFGDGLEEGVNV